MIEDTGNPAMQAKLEVASTPQATSKAIYQPTTQAEYRAVAVALTDIAGSLGRGSIAIGLELEHTLAHYTSSDTISSFNTIMFIYRRDELLRVKATAFDILTGGLRAYEKAQLELLLIIWPLTSASTVAEASSSYSRQLLASYGLISKQAARKAVSSSSKSKSSSTNTGN